MNEKDRRYEPDESFFSEEELEMLADASGESIRAEIDEYKKKAEESPLSSSEMPDEEILRMLKSKDRSRAKAKKRQKFSKLTRAAAVFLISVVVVGAIGVGTSEAFRVKVFSIFKNDDTGSVTMINENEEELLADWSDYWYPEYMPEGFVLDGAEADEIEKAMHFSLVNGDAEIIISVGILDYFVISHNIEDCEVEEVDIGYYKGYMFTDKLYNTCDVIWQTDENLMSIDAIGYTDKGEILKIAENLKYIP